MSHDIGWDGVVHDVDTGQRIGVVDTVCGGILLDEDVYRDDGRYDDETDVVADMAADARDWLGRTPGRRFVCD